MPSGPVPKRSSQRHRKGGTSFTPPDTAPGARDVVMPDPDPAWHPIALGWYMSLADSGQSFYYQPSDWAMAQYVAEAMSKNLNQGKFSSMLFANVISAAGNLMATEGDRRRLRLELTQAQEADGDSDTDRAIADLLTKFSPEPADDSTEQLSEADRRLARYSLGDDVSSPAERRAGWAAVRIHRTADRIHPLVVRDR